MNKVITNSFEGIEQIAKGGTQQVKKMVEAVTTDIKESIVGDVKPLTEEEQRQLVVKDEQEKQKHLNLVRQNLKKIDEEIMRIKKEREQKQIQTKQVDHQQTQQKKVEKKQEESALAKMIKSRKGTKEGMQRASG